MVLNMRILIKLIQTGARPLKIEKRSFYHFFLPSKMLSGKELQGIANLVDPDSTADFKAPEHDIDINNLDYKYVANCTDREEISRLLEHLKYIYLTRTTKFHIIHIFILPLFLNFRQDQIFICCKLGR